LDFWIANRIANAILGWKMLEDEGVNTLLQSIAEDQSYTAERYRRFS